MPDAVTLVVNGERRSLDVEGRTLLVHALRDGLGLTGAHIGCDTSQCGACTVLLDGRAVKSCTVLAHQVGGTEITTIEGLARDGELHPIQRAFVEHHGLQCGFCTPGVILTAADLLSRDGIAERRGDPPCAPRQPLSLHGLPGHRRVDPRRGGGLVIPAATRYARASSVEHALELLAEPDARALAGGQSLIPVMKLRIARPSLVVDISRLELRGVEERDGAVHVGPLTTWNELIDAGALARPGLEAIAECARGIGDLQVRNLGTIGGSVVHADPASDMPAVLLALGAHLRLRSPAGERKVPLTDLLVGPFTTTLAPQELVDRHRRPASRTGLRIGVRLRRAPRLGIRARRRGRARRSRRRDGRARWSRRDAVRPARGRSEAAIAEAEVFGDGFASAEYRRELAAVRRGARARHGKARAKEDR